MAFLPLGWTMAGVGLTVIISIAGSLVSFARQFPVAVSSACWRGRGPGVSAHRTVCTLVVVMFALVQTAALAHEIQHVLQQHDGPCVLHVVADHLAMAIAPVPSLTVVALATDQLLSTPDNHLSPPAQPSSARAPPVLS
jgi:hypothetical protein